MHCERKAACNDSGCTLHSSNDMAATCRKGDATDSGGLGAYCDGYSCAAAQHVKSSLSQVLTDKRLDCREPSASLTNPETRTGSGIPSCHLRANLSAHHLPKLTDLSADVPSDMMLGPRKDVCFDPLLDKERVRTLFLRCMSQPSFCWPRV